MRTVPPEILNTQGLEPINIVRVFWAYGQGNQDVDNETNFQNHIDYSDDAAVIEIGKMSIGTALTSSASSVNVRLADLDGKIKQIFNTSDIHHRPVQILQWFRNYPLVHAFIVFEGLINSPIIWNERQQTLQFTIINLIEDVEVGFSVEEGDFPYIPQFLYNKPWPQVFGTAFSVPCLQLNKVPKALIQEATALYNLKNAQKQNTNIAKAIANIEQQLAELYASQRLYSIKSFNCNFEGDQAQAQGNIQLANSYYSKAKEYQNDADRIMFVDIPNFNEMQQIAKAVAPIQQANAAKLEALKKAALNATNGWQFPQQVQMNIMIGAYAQQGVFNGGVFVVTGEDDLQLTTAGMLPTNVTQYEHGVLYNTPMPSGNFAFIPGGTQLTASGLTVRYVVSLGACGVLSLEADRTVNGVTARYIIPPQCYIITIENFNGLLCTMATFPRPMSTYDIFPPAGQFSQTNKPYVGPGWKDDIRANVVGPVGPNGIDILIYLIETYTMYGWDNTTFTFVHAQVNAFECNFALLTKKNILNFMKDIAYQLQCAVFLRNNIFYIVYLPYPYTPVDTFTMNDVSNLTVVTTPTEDIVTRYTVQWRSFMDQEDPYEVVFRNNLYKYGLHSQQDDFYCFNNLNVVQIAALFWNIRKSNMWKKVQFTTPLHKLNIEVFDFVSLDFGEPFVSNGPVIGMVEAADYDSENNTISFTIWTPVRIGEMSAYQYAYTATIDYVFDSPDAGSQFNYTGQLVDPVHTYGSAAPNYAGRNDSGNGIVPGNNFDAEPNVDLYTSVNSGSIDPGTNPGIVDQWNQITVGKAKTTTIADTPVTPTVYVGTITGPSSIMNGIVIWPFASSDGKFTISAYFPMIQTGEIPAPGTSAFVSVTNLVQTLSDGSTVNLPQYTGYTATMGLRINPNQT